MPVQSWVQHVGGPGPGVAGPVLNNSTTETDISPTPAIVIPANFLNYIGAKLRLVAWGVYGTTGTPTLRLSFYPNGFANAGTSPAFAGTGDITTPTTVTNAPWRMEWEGVVRAIALGSATIIGSGFAQIGAAPQASGVVAAWSSQVPLPDTAIVATTIVPSSSMTITAAAKWGTANSLNTITCHDLTVLSLT